MNTINKKNKICEETKEMINNVMDNIVPELGLEHVDFEVGNMDDFIESMQEESNRMSGVVLYGEDNIYIYRIGVYAYYEDEEDYDNDELELTNISKFSVMRIPRESPEFENYEEYVFDQGKWTKAVIDKLKFTPKQLKMIENSKNLDQGKIVLLLILKDYNMLPISDKNFDEMCRKYRGLLEIYNETSRFVDLDVMEDGSIRLYPMLDYDGINVSYEKGTYKLNLCCGDEILQTIVNTTDKKEIIQMLGFMLDKSFIPDTVAVLPLSKDTMVSLTVSGDLTIFSLRKRNYTLSKKEESLIETYFDACEKIVL